MTTTTNPHPDVPLPAGAVFGDKWEGEPVCSDAMVARSVPHFRSCRGMV
jgi:hypothetical protein